MARILIVDDSFLQRRILSGFIRNHGHEPVDVESGKAGLEELTKGDIDILLLDLLMPGLSGFDVLKQVRGSGHDLPVVIVSADIQQEARSRCEELGATAFLNKPVNDEGLFTAINPLLSRTKSA
ncbi:MAG: CheY-like chemotaxis protein [Planctomycetota bacterium]|jgi:CheY-like chemotaxis protein